jgi:membrane protease YdiL (CAAX protease family)
MRPETNMTFIDHLFFFGLTVGYPIYSFFSFRQLMRRVAAGEVISRSEIYKSTIIGLWALMTIGLAIWIVTGRSWTDLGFGWSFDTGFLIGLALTIIAIVILVWQFGRLDGSSDETCESLRGQLGKLEIIIPRNDNELGQFYAVSATAGIVEETLWRGYMFWYLGHLMPLWAAAVVTSVAFGVGHIYQGAANVPRVVLLGGAFAGLYLLTGSVWLPMLLHAVLDAVQGRAIYKMFSSAAAAHANRRKKREHPPSDRATP